MATIYPSLFAVGLKNAADTIKELTPYCQGFHIDVMDGEFVPNTTWSATEVNELSKLTDRQLWVQLMVLNPEEWLKNLELPAYSLVSVHLESTGSVRNLFKIMREKKWLTSVAINPSTNVESIFPMLNEIDQVLIMSVNPGFSGQEFMPSVLEKIDALVGFRQTSGLPFKIGIDGGVCAKNIGLLVEKGVDDLVVGSDIFGKPNPVEALKILDALVKDPFDVDITQYHKEKKSDKKK